MKHFLKQQNDADHYGRPFIKMQGLKNDFIIVDARTMDFQPTVKEIIQICDRRIGVGGDELVILEPPKMKPQDLPAVFMRIINPDGRDVEACGNATRCVGWLLFEESGMDDSIIETVAGSLRCFREGEKQVAVNMGRLRTVWNEIPLSSEMDTLHLEIGAGPLRDPVGMNIGNPHAVFFVDDLETVDLKKYGPQLQKHQIFPEEANIGAAQMIDAKTLKLSVWERPGVMTNACGSGACAAVGAAHRRGLTQEKKMTVIMPAGSLTIEIGRDDVTMTGPVELTFTGYLPVHD